MRLFVFADNYRVGRLWLDRHGMSNVPDANVISSSTGTRWMLGIDNPICVMLPNWEKNFQIPSSVLEFIKNKRGICVRPYE